MRLLTQDLAAARPGPHDDEAGGAEQQRHVAAVEHLVEVGDEEGDVDRQERRDQQEARHSGQRQSFQTTKKASEVVITIVPATAMP